PAPRDHNQQPGVRGAAATSGPPGMAALPVGPGRLCPRGPGNFEPLNAENTEDAEIGRLLELLTIDVFA
ncbi:MAG: hypothetical protein ACKVVP_22740, partial [Chloroflexota bacterium]